MIEHRRRLRDSLIVLFAIVIFLAATEFVFPVIGTTMATPPSPTTPAAPKTRAQIQAEAYALQAQINAAAGRKTSNASDGTGGTRSIIVDTDTRGSFLSPKTGVCVGDSETAPYIDDNACDADDSTTWVSANSAYPHSIEIQLTSGPVDGVFIVWGNYPPATFHVDCDIAASWVPFGNFTTDVNDLNHNRTYLLDRTCTTALLRVYGTSQTPLGADFMGTFEVWPFHYYPNGNGVFDSASLGMGDWTSQFRSLTWTQTGTITIFVRVSNNSDLSSPSAWHSVTSGTNEDSLNLVAGFLQYRAYLNGTAPSIAAVALRYTGQSTGDPPSKTVAGEIRHDSHYVHATFDLSVTSLIVLLEEDRIVTFDNSKVEINDANHHLNISDQSAAQGTGPTILLTINSRNTTFSNASFFFTSDTVGAGYRSATVSFNFDNSTLQHFNSTWHRTKAISPVTNAAYVHDSDIFDYNRGNLSFAAVPTSTIFDRTRTHDFRAQGDTFNGVISDNPREAKWNYMIGGFLQFVYGSDGSGIAIGNGSSVEYVNWSFNYAQASKHTVFGSYGTAFGHFANPTLRDGYFHTIYRNYINNSRYIAIQSSGNVSGLRVIGNYIQGTSPSFTEAIGIFEQDHDFVVSGNYLWNLNTVNNRGITITCFVYNVLISANVIYDVGVWGINFQCLGLKFKNETDVEKSDYSWHGMNIRVTRNYLSGFTLNTAIEMDSGYITFDNNTVTNAPAGILQLDDGWGCYFPVCGINSTAWLDWVDGYPYGAALKVVWPVVPAVHEKDFWVRDMRTSAVAVSSSNFPIYVNTNISNSTYFGLLSVRCVETPGDGTTNLEVFLWTGKSCPAVQDSVNRTYGAGGVQYVVIPNRWLNQTITYQFLPSTGHVTGTPPGSLITARDSSMPFTGNVASNGTWAIKLGHPYAVRVVFSTVGADAIAAGFALFQVLAFVAFLTLILIGAYLLKKRRGGAGV